MLIWHLLILLRGKLSGRGAIYIGGSASVLGPY